MINSFNKKTPKAVKTALLRAKESGKRVRIWYGNAKTGKAWLEEYGVEGYVGNSTGPLKVAILCYNSRSTGGGAILDHCIVRIRFTRGGTLYCHPKFSMPELSIVKSDLPEYAVRVLVDGSTHARFKNESQARHWVNRMSA